MKLLIWLDVLSLQDILQVDFTVSFYQINIYDTFKPLLCVHVSSDGLYLIPTSHPKNQKEKKTLLINQVIYNLFLFSFSEVLHGFP